MPARRGYLVMSGFPKTTIGFEPTEPSMSSMPSWESHSRLPPSSPIAARIQRLQDELFQLGAELATPRGKKVPSALIEDSHVEMMEHEIDEMETHLPALKNFILPGGTPLSATIHFARTVSRRAERELTSLNRAEPCRPVVLRYMNRLSDYLFVCARFANHLAAVPDTPWHAPTPTP